ncbi:MAG: UDP-N-acetylmuramate dehydrogenase [Acidobacteria bacterium]|nr:UDP-N-acetylmuramate dehydrogenase [Acidobacteriota bacterium]
MSFNPKPNFNLSDFTTFGIGGLARWVAEIQLVADLVGAWNWARDRRIRVLFVGEGSNILFSDEGFDGLVLINQIRGIQRAEAPPRVGDSSTPVCSESEEVRAYLRVGGGVNLMSLIRWCNNQSLAGLEKMYGIPGTVAGAVVGNAGAYGQEIREVVAEVTVWDGKAIRVLTHRQLDLRYRHSILKENRHWFLVECLLRMRQSGENLQQVSDAIQEIRMVKYPCGIKCPGSFFKNVEVVTLLPDILDRIPPEFVMHGKIPAGRLLEAVGACGARCGQAMIASYHGNLFVNMGGACSRDVLKLATEFGNRVYKTFGIRLEPEVFIVDGQSFE